VHKLRGSLGWIHCKRCRTLYVAGAGCAAPGELDGDHPCIHADSQRERLVAGPGLRGRPRSVLGRVRAHAVEALARAERVVLLGEPPDLSDPFVRWVLRRGAVDRRKPPQVLAAGPGAADHGETLRAWFGASVEGGDYHDLDALADHLGRPDTLF
jgi:hypothetical protein